MKHKWGWFFRDLNDENRLLLLNFKKHLLTRNISNKTIDEYQREVRGLMKFLQDKNIETFNATTDDIQDYLDSFDASNSRKTRVISVLNTFFKHNYRKRYIKVNPVEDIDRNKYK